MDARVERNSSIKIISSFNHGKLLDINMEEQKIEQKPY